MSEMNLAGFREVSDQEFYDAIGSQNVTPYPRGIWPYCSDFKTQSGEICGKKISVEENGKVNTRYYLPCSKKEASHE